MMENWSMLQEHVNKTCNVLQQFSSLIDSHMVDFLTCDLWNKLVPEDIRQEVSVLGADEAYNILTHVNVQRNVLDSPIRNFLKETMNVSSLGTLTSQDLWTLLDNSGGELQQTEPQLSMFMSGKKAHEVQMLSRVIASVAKIKEIGCVIDLGGGKGYLGFTLAHHYGLRVLSIDCAQVNTHGALKLAHNLEKCWNTMQQNKVPEKITNLDQMYKHTTTFVHPETNLKEIVQEQFQNDDLDLNLDKMCLVGLHACGDLTPSCLRLFCINQSIQALCIVGCCYNLITENAETVGPDGVFFMSTYLKEKEFKLSRNARMLAAQSVDRITQDNKEPPTSLWYRAMLQVLLNERGDSPDLRVGRSKTHIGDFQEYVSRALTKLKLPQASREQVNKIQGNHDNRRKLHDIFFMMRVALAPVIESLILLDRLLYLHEQGIKHTYLVRLFDSVISPRCCGIIAFKD